MKAISQCDLLLLYYGMFQYTAVYVMTFSILHRVPGVPDPYSLTDPLFNVVSAFSFAGNVPERIPVVFFHLCLPVT